MHKLDTVYMICYDITVQCTDTGVASFLLILNSKTTISGYKNVQS